MEIVNFGVEDFSLGQAYLGLQDKLEYDHVILVFVAVADLWREINVSRKIGQDWDFYITNPRFAIEGDTFKLIPGPYSNLQELVDDNRETISPTLRNHLRKYDAFYFKPRYESTPVLDLSVMYKFFKRHWAKKERTELLSGLMSPGSEAMQITRLTVEAMTREVMTRGSRFSYVILPTLQEVRKFRCQQGFRNRWDQMSSYLGAGDFKCHDLMGYFQKILYKRLDVTCDKWHFGPRTNQRSAIALLEKVLQ